MSHCSDDPPAAEGSRVQRNRLFRSLLREERTRSIPNPPQNAINRIHSNARDLLHVSDIDAAREISEQPSNLDSPVRDHEATTPDSPPDNFDPETMLEADMCPICYSRVATSGFTRCQHRVCPYCLYRLLASLGNNSPISRPGCPLCRQGEPRDIDMYEVARVVQQEMDSVPARGTHYNSRYPSSTSPAPILPRVSPRFLPSPQSHPSPRPPNNWGHYDSSLDDDYGQYFEDSYDVFGDSEDYDHGLSFEDLFGDSDDFSCYYYDSPLDSDCGISFEDLFGDSDDFSCYYYDSP